MTNQERTEVAEHSVVIAGGGPTGLMLAGELALAGIDVAIVERRANQDLDGSRSGGLHARTLELLDQRGIAERFIEAGQKHPAVGYSGISLDISDFPTRHPYVLALWQKEFEPILAGWVDDLGVPIHRRTSVTRFAQRDDGVEIERSDGRTLRAGYLIGCDGGRSTIRKAAGIDFVGLDAATSWIIAEVTMDGDPEVGMRHDDLGTHGIGPSGNDALFRVVLTEREVHTASGDDHPDMSDLRAALEAVYGTDFGLRSADWISRFTDTTRQASSYRDRRVLLAGDAAHVHPPQGGQGLNTGVQDAVNLGWKLAQVINGTSPDSLLDSYQAERHPVAARVLQNTMAQVALGRADERHQALRDAMTELLELDGPRTHIAAMLSGLDIHYDLGDGHPLVGRRMPDVDLDTADGPTRVAELLRDARPVLLQLGGHDSFDITPWADRITMISATHTGPWELPVIGEVTPPAALAIRPDGHVAWAGDLAQPDLTEALTTWFGPPEAQCDSDAGEVSSAEAGG